MFNTGWISCFMALFDGLEHYFNRRNIWSYFPMPYFKQTCKSVFLINALFENVLYHVLSCVNEQLSTPNSCNITHLAHAKFWYVSVPHMECDLYDTKYELCLIFLVANNAFHWDHSDNLMYVFYKFVITRCGYNHLQHI